MRDLVLVIDGNMWWWPEIVDTVFLLYYFSIIIIIIIIMLVVASKISFSELTISTFHKLPSSDAESHYHPLPMTCLLHCAWLLGALLLHYLLLIKSSMFPILAIFMPYAIALVKKWIQFWISTQPFPFPFPFPTMISKPFLFPNCWEPS